MSFRNINVVDASWEHEAKVGLDVLHVCTSHGLMLAAGYLKYNEPSGIYFRGQRKLYATLQPTAYRTVKSVYSRGRVDSSLRSTMVDYRKACPALAKFGDYATEPLLQHYGLHTTWVDLVDNIWVALWFACHQAKATRDGRFVHFERMSPHGDHRHVYLLLVATDLTERDASKPGYFYGPDTEMVDLRQAAPSYFLRPHAQHGLLFRRRGEPGKGRPTDYFKQVKGIIRVNLCDALAWLGDGRTVSLHALFPPAYYDNGFKMLHESSLPAAKCGGSIFIVGA